MKKQVWRKNKGNPPPLMFDENIPSLIANVDRLTEFGLSSLFLVKFRRYYSDGSSNWDIFNETELYSPNKLALYFTAMQIPQFEGEEIVHRDDLFLRLKDIPEITYFKPVIYSYVATFLYKE